MIDQNRACGLRKRRNSPGAHAVSGRRRRHVASVIMGNDDLGDGELPQHRAHGRQRAGNAVRIAGLLDKSHETAARVTAGNTKYLPLQPRVEMECKKWCQRARQGWGSVKRSGKPGRLRVGGGCGWHHGQ
jgi:hypothetical protein